jgi:phosphonate transport system substrate-binding protein
MRESAPLVARLARAAGMPVTLTVPVNYAAVVEALVHETVDLAYLGGFTYVQSVARAGVEPLVQRERDRAFHSVIIANAATGIRGLPDLKAHRFAFGDINSTSGHLMPAYFMRQAGIRSEVLTNAIYSGGHDATALAVANGTVDAGALDETILERLLESGAIARDRITLLYKTPPFFDYVWVTRKGLSPTIREAIGRSFLELERTRPDDARVLDLLGATKYLAARDGDYDTLRQAARAQGLFK